ncbi:hypothetical protein HK098_002714 [Nowakowskiella sp. JEL0407]|nr:hypothetical protein HK098_002714 [Nowakowskiella sp. JEL0407]
MINLKLSYLIAIYLFTALAQVSGQGCSGSEFTSCYWTHGAIGKIIQLQVPNPQSDCDSIFDNHSSLLSGLRTTKICWYGGGNMCGFLFDESLIAYAEQSAGCYNCREWSDVFQYGIGGLTGVYWDYCWDR